MKKKCHSHLTEHYPSWTLQQSPLEIINSLKTNDSGRIEKVSISQSCWQIMPRQEKGHIAVAHAGI